MRLLTNYVQNLQLSELGLSQGIKIFFEKKHLKSHLE